MKKKNKNINKSRKNKTKKYSKNKQTTHTRKRKDKHKHNSTPLKCSPNPHKNDFSCLDNRTLYKLKELWNIRHGDSLITTKNPFYIWKTLKNKYSSVCEKESCWIKDHFNGVDLHNTLDHLFAPESPDEWEQNPNEWLSSDDLINVMKQYEKHYKCFNFIGPSPIDYDYHKIFGNCVWDELCKFNISEQIKNKKTKIGIIFNLDPHYKGGSHWVSLFINLEKGFIFYFDSAGEKIPKQIKKFSDEVIKQCLQVEPKIKMKFDENYPKEHQKGDTECGMYALYFIINLLKDHHTPEYFKNHVISDKSIEKCREVYYNPDL